MRHVAGRVAGLGIDVDAHQIVAGAIDQVAVGIDLEVAAAGVVGHAVEHRHVVGDGGRLLNREEAIAVDRHVGTDGRRGDGTLGGDGLLGERRHAAGGLLVRRGRIGDQILEGGFDALVAGGRGVRDVARDVLQGEGLRLQAAHRCVKRVEDTHNIVSTLIRRPWKALCRNSMETVASVMPTWKIPLDQMLERKCPGRMTGAQLPGRQLLPGDERPAQLACGPAGWNTSAKPSMQ